MEFNIEKHHNNVEEGSDEKMQEIKWKEIDLNTINQEEVVNLYSTVWNKEPKEFQEQFNRHVTYPRFHAVGAYAEDKLVGYVYGYSSQPGQYYHDKLAEALQETPEWMNETMELVELMVNPDFSGQGIGKQLVTKWLSSLHGHVLLTTKADNRKAQELYEKLGFEQLKNDFQPNDSSNWIIYGKVIPWILPNIETDRLLLRPWQKEDAEDLYAYAKDDRVGPMAGWAPHKNVEESLEVIGFFQSAGDTYAIEWKETGTVIGGIGLHDRRPDADRQHMPQREIGYVLSPEYWGKGIMPEAVEAVIHHGFVDMNLDIIWCGHFNFNNNSRRVVEKTGFSYLWTKPFVLTRLGNREVQNLLYIQTREDYLQNRN
ncbi:MAG: GNAT family N-acetyltransferase [Firmicutes bacterium]|nr:GNAT family N-acetyltransferase [Bacillota bacterium]